MGEIKFGFVCHPLDMSDLYRFEPGYRGQSLQALQEIRRRSKPVLLGGFDGIKTHTGIDISGLLFSILLLPHEILQARPRDIRKRLLEVVQLARESGCVNLGLGSYWSVWGNGGKSLVKKASLPITSGATFSALASVQTIKRAIDMLGRDLASQRIAIIGATGAIGRLMTLCLASQARSLSLIARHTVALKILAGETKSANCSCHTSIQEGVRDCDVVIFCTNTPDDLTGKCIFSPGTLICDISRPRNFHKTSLSHHVGVLAVDGGIIIPPGKCHTTFDIRLPHGMVYPCVAETMILAAMGVQEPFSLGRDISAEKLSKMEKWAKEQGFKVSPPLSFGTPLSGKSHNTDLVVTK